MTIRQIRAPLALGWLVRRARELAEPAAAWGAWSSRRRRAAAVPPRRLRARAGAPGSREFLEGGHRAALSLTAALEAANGSAEQLGSVLDFGCGSGRVLPHIAALARRAHCTGCDVDARAVGWAARHWTQFEWAQTGFEPPLPFDPGRFDLVYSISVFSHLDEALQDRWLDELRRILKPGGFALLSVHGPSAFEDFRTGAVRTAWCRPEAFERDPLQPRELVFEPYTRSVWNVGELPGIGSAYGLAFHGADYLRSHWSRALDVVDVRERAIAGWQDLVVCRR